MSDAVLVAIIGAIPASLTLVLSMAVVFHAWHVPSKLNELVEHTNSLTDKLVEKTDIAGIASHRLYNCITCDGSFVEGKSGGRR